MFLKINFRFILIGIIIFIFSGCSSSLVNYNTATKVLSLKIGNKNKKELHFKNPQYIPNAEYCVDYMYTIIDKDIPQYGNILVQHISLSSNCDWNVFPDSFFIQKIQKYYKAKNIKLVSNKDIGQYAFYTYKLFYKYKIYKTIYMIGIWGANENTFIVDENGKFFNELKILLEKR